MTTAHRIVALAGSMAVAALACGCQATRNERLVVGPEGSPSAVMPPTLWASAPIAQATGPSATGASREHWGEVTIVAANDGVEHHEPFTRRWPVCDTATARSRGEFPTVETAVETGGSAGAQVGEGFAWPLAIGSDIVMAIPRVFDRAERSPMEPYDRSKSEYRTTPPAAQ